MKEQLNEKNQKRLLDLLNTFDSGAVQPEELKEVSSTIMEVLGNTAKKLTASIEEAGTKANKEVTDAIADLRATEKNVKDLIAQTNTNSRSETQKLISQVTKELQRVEQSIPELPDDVDLSDIYTDLQTHTDRLEQLEVLITAENIRNALESIPEEDDKLKIEAIGHLQEKLDELKSLAQSKGGGAGAIIARYLYQIGDVEVEGATDGQVLTYEASTGLWKPTTVSGGGGTWGSITGTLADQTDLQTVLDTIPDSVDDLGPSQAGNSGKYLTTDGSNASWVTLAGGGDMAAATYDPQAISADAFDTDNHTDGTTNKVYTATEKTKLSNIEAAADVTDTANVTAAGALMDSEITNLAQVKAFDTTDYATAAQGALADSAQQPPAEGAFVDGDKTKLDGIEASADVTDATNVAAAGAHMSGGTDVPVTDGGTGASTASGARTNLGLAIGTDVQAYDANLPTWPSTVDATEVGYLNGVTSAIQDQIDGKDAWGDTVDADIVPDTTFTHNIGSSSKYFSNLYTQYVIGSSFKGYDDQFSVAKNGGATITAFLNNTGTPVNAPTLKNSETGTPVEIGALGTDTDISINLIPKGAGEGQINGVRILTEAPEVGSTTSSATPTINTDLYEVYRLTAQAVDITSFTTNLSGTPTHGQKLFIEITGTATRAITWGASFEDSTISLPTTTDGTNMLTVGLRYNSATSKWRCIGSV